MSCALRPVAGKRAPLTRWAPFISAAPTGHQRAISGETGQKKGGNTAGYEWKRSLIPCPPTPTPQDPPPSSDAHWGRRARGASVSDNGISVPSVFFTEFDLLVSCASSVLVCTLMSSVDVITFFFFLTHIFHMFCLRVLVTWGDVGHNKKLLVLWMQTVITATAVGGNYTCDRIRWLDFFVHWPVRLSIVL